MSRTRASAKAAGSRFERQVADYLNAHVDDRIDRRVKTGNRDRGDVGGLRHMTQPVVVECKDTSRIELGVWAGEAETERGNADAGSWLVIHKRHGKGDPAEQWVTTTLGELVALLTGSRAHLDDPALDPTERTES